MYFTGRIPLSYAYHDINNLVRTAAMAKNNNNYNVGDYYEKIDNMAKSFVSTIFPFYPAGEDIGINFPAINDDFLQGLTTVSFLEILHSEFYPSGQSPYATILLEDQDTFDNFIFSDTDGSTLRIVITFIVVPPSQVVTSLIACILMSLYGFLACLSILSFFASARIFSRSSKEKTSFSNRIAPV